MMARKMLEEQLYRNNSVNPITSSIALNYRIDIYNEGDKEKNRKVPLASNEVVENILLLCQHRFARMDDLVFLKPEIPGDEIIFCNNSHSFFGLLGKINESTVEWISSTGAMSKAEAFAATVPDLHKYDAIEHAPHYPEKNNTYYNHPVLPKAQPDKLDQLINYFCPETEQDKALIASSFLSSFWGGGTNRCPAFIITSKAGRGVGKTTLVEMIATLLNQTAISSSTKGNFAELKTRLLSQEGLKCRVVLFDNETGYVASSELAELITCQSISGKRLYSGEGKRPNNLLWCITLNTPSLDSDLACRGIPISLSKPIHSKKWRDEISEFIDINRWKIISTIIELLKSETQPIQNTRWSAWENGVLSKTQRWFPDTNALLKTIAERQREFNDEADEIQLIREGFERIISSNGVSSKLYPLFFSNHLSANIYNEATGTKVRKNTALRAIKNLIRTNSIPELEQYHHGKFGRGFLWVNENASPNEAIHEVKPLEGGY